MFRLIIGFALGVVVSRNAQPYATPFWGAICLGAALGAVLFYIFGKRDKNTAVATAVAVAISEANAKADARAQAIANSAVQIVLQSGQVPSERELQIIAEYHDGEIANDSRNDALTALTAKQESSRAIA